jgi:hypothetical protein
MTSAPGTASSRAVMRLVEPGNDAMCAHCGRQVKFAARVHPRQVIVNVYEDGVWKRIEHFHEECYAEAGEPFGPAVDPRPAR